MLCWVSLHFPLNFELKCCYCLQTCSPFCFETADLQICVSVNHFNFTFVALISSPNFLHSISHLCTTFRIIEPLSTNQISEIFVCILLGLKKKAVYRSFQQCKLKYLPRLFMNSWFLLIFLSLSSSYSDKELSAIVAYMLGTATWKIGNKINLLSLLLKISLSQSCASWMNKISSLQETSLFIENEAHNTAETVQKLKLELKNSLSWRKVKYKPFVFRGN